MERILHLLGPVTHVLLGTGSSTMPGCTTILLQTRCPDSRWILGNAPENRRFQEGNFSSIDWSGQKRGQPPMDRSVSGQEWRVASLQTLSSLDQTQFQQLSSCSRLCIPCICIWILHPTWNISSALLCCCPLDYNNISLFLYKNTLEGNDSVSGTRIRKFCYRNISYSNKAIRGVSNIQFIWLSHQ